MVKGPFQTDDLPGWQLRRRWCTAGVITPTPPGLRQALVDITADQVAFDRPGQCTSCPESDVHSQLLVGELGEPTLDEVSSMSSMWA